jgi:hypothetical protein
MYSRCPAENDEVSNLHKERLPRDRPTAWHPQDWNSSSIKDMITTQLLRAGSTDHCVRTGGQFSALPVLTAKSRGHGVGGFGYGGGFKFRARYLPSSSTTSATRLHLRLDTPLSVINIGGSSQRRFPKLFPSFIVDERCRPAHRATVPGRVLRKHPIEADHGRLKSRLRAMRGLKQLRCAQVKSPPGTRSSKPTGPGYLRRARHGDLQQPQFERLLPTGCGCWAPTTPTPWAPAPTSPTGGVERQAHDVDRHLVRRGTANEHLGPVRTPYLKLIIVPDADPSNTPKKIRRIAGR